MEIKHIDIDNNKWGVLLVYDFDMIDWDDMAAYMHTFGLSEKQINRSIRVLSEYNTGMTISRDDIRMSLVFISDASSMAEWWDTVNHELYHVNNAIIDYYGERWDGEPPAYLQGYLLKRVVQEIAEPCR